MFYNSGENDVYKYMYFENGSAVVCIYAYTYNRKPFSNIHASFSPEVMHFLLWNQLLPLDLHLSIRSSQKL